MNRTTPPRLALALALACGALAAPGRASAAIGALDPVPAATLLFPYFEVSTAEGATDDVVLTVVNVDGTARLAQVTLWTDQGVPVLSFPLHLAASGRVSFGLRDVLGGALPPTGSGAVAGCEGALPPAIDAATAEVLVAALRGEASSLLGGACGGRALGDGVARGYVTVDGITECTDLDPSDAAFWGAGPAAYDNVFLGEMTFFAGDGRAVYGDRAVHLEASLSDPLTMVAGSVTFYGRFVSWAAHDHREGLPSVWAVEAVDRQTEVIVWRDMQDATADGYPCGAAPSGYALESLTAFSFDRAETATDITEVATFPAAAGRYAVGSEGLPLVAKKGFFHLDLASPPGATTGTPADFQLRQAVVLAVHYPDAQAERRSAALAYGAPLATANDPTGTYHQDGSPRSPNDAPPMEYAVGAILSLDDAPAATLLLPYFEVGLDDPNAANTTFTLTNTSATAVLARITLWTDHGIPTIALPLYLTGFDAAEVDLKHVFHEGLLELTGSDGQDPNDSRSPQGQFSQDINFASCTGTLPLDVLDAAALDDLRAAHLGAPYGAGGLCAGRDIGDGIARGYVTVDLVNSCTFSPLGSAEAYSISSSLTRQDYLTGEFILSNRADGVAHSAKLVAIHSDLANTEVANAGEYTFYGRFHGHTAADRREPLASRWAAPFVNGARGATELIVFQEPAPGIEPFACDAPPSPLEQASILLYDDEDNSTYVTGTPLPVAASRVPIGEGGLGATYGAGYVEIDFDRTSGTGGPTEDPLARQAFVSTVRTFASATDGVGSHGFPLEIAGGAP